VRGRNEDMSRPIVENMMEDLNEVLDRYRETYSITYCEAVGCLSILSRELYKETEKGEDEEIM
jgi:hypothetical protein